MASNLAAFRHPTPPGKPTIAWLSLGCSIATEFAENEMRARFAITVAVGFGLILAGAIQTAIHQNAQDRVSAIRNR
jgi:pimeloyl-ACP methyl ester carboxylesterase